MDLLLIHSPSLTVPIEETIGAMNSLQDEKKVRHIGVSNFSVRQTQDAVEASKTPIITNQVEYHPYRHQEELLEYCRQNAMLLTAYSPLAKGRVAGDTTLREIARAHGKTAVQVVLRWLIQQDRVITIPKSENPDHLRENWNVVDFELSEDEIKQIRQLKK